MALLLYAKTDFSSQQLVFNKENTDYCYIIYFFIK